MSASGPFRPVDAAPATSKRTLDAVGTARAPRRRSLLRRAHLLLASAVFAAPAGVRAAFTPADRNALQTALYDCVGACTNEYPIDGGRTDCREGAYLYGTGAACDATSTNGAIEISLHTCM